MDTGEFWALVEAARGDDKPLHEAVADRLATASTDQVFAFQDRFDELYHAVYRWDVWAAAYLIGGGCSDDSFSDFCTGLVSLGRDWYERAARSPDALADHPTVGRRDCPIFFEEFGNAAARAYERLAGTDCCEFYEALAERDAARDTSGSDEGMGEEFPFTEAELRRRLPRLATLCLGEPAGGSREGGVSGAVPAAG